METTTEWLHTHQIKLGKILTCSVNNYVIFFFYIIPQVLSLGNKHVDKMQSQE